MARTRSDEDEAHAAKVVSCLLTKAEPADRTPDSKRRHLDSEPSSPRPRVNAEAALYVSIHNADRGSVRMNSPETALVSW